MAYRFEEKKVLARLEALDAKARRHGVAALDASRNELIGIGMETAPGGQVTRNCYGVFHLSWLAEKHPEWPRLILDELDDLDALCGRLAESFLLRDHDVLQLAPSDPPPIDLSTALASALADPAGTPPLHELARGRRTAGPRRARAVRTRAPPRRRTTPPSSAPPP